MAELNDKLVAGKRFTFSIQGISGDSFAAISLSGQEQISQTYWFELDLLSENTDIQFQDAIHKGATLEIMAESGGKTTYHGVVTRFQQLQEIDQRALYRVRMEPWLLNARGQVQSEVYLDKTVPAIIDGVFKDSGLSVNDYQLRLTGDVNNRSYEYLCQYEESDLNFLQWRLEQDGVYYFFEDDGSSEKTVFANNQTSQGGATRKLTYKPVSGTENDDTLEDSVQRIVRSEELLPKTVLVRNYDYRKAALDIRCEEVVSIDGVGQVALYGEPVGTQADAQKVAKLRAQELACRGVIYEADATAVGIRPGMTVELTDHYRSDFNTKYWVTEVRHLGSQSGAFLAGLKDYKDQGRSESAPFYRCTFKAIPNGVQYRPPRTTVRPKIEGTLSGFVDAEGSGKYAELDDQGRYKVQVPFDLTDKRAQRASAWLRFATPYAGPDEGMHFPLRKDSEVLLSFEGGDPNRPIIIGSVANSEHANLVTNRNATYNMLQTGGGNLLQMQDQEGSQHIVLGTPTSNSFLAMGAGSGAALVANALGAVNGDSADSNPAPTMVQYTQADQLIKAQGSLRVEVGPTATTTATLVAGDTSLTTNNNLLGNIGGYAQLNVGSSPLDTVSPTPAAGDVQINTTKDFTINAAKECSLDASTQTVNVAGNYNLTVEGNSTIKYNGYFSNSAVTNDYVYGYKNTSINIGMVNMFVLAVFVRVFLGVRLTVFLSKNDFAYSRWERIGIYKFDWVLWGEIKGIWGAEAVTCVLNEDLNVTKIDVDSVAIHTQATRLASAITAVKTAALENENAPLILKT